jgi:uncharacterized protein (TIGR03663 family)
VYAAGVITSMRRRLSFEHLFILIFILALVLRFAVLDLKLLHHDEAVHAWFSYQLLTTGAYTYDPMYHGPFLYYVTAGMFFLFGDSDLVARVLPALFGVMLIPLIYAIYRLGYLDRKQTLVVALFIALSPNLVYFSRFLRHDIFQLFFTLLVLVALLAYLNRGQLRYALLAGLAIGGGMTLKEDMPIFLFILAGFALFLLLTRRVRFPTHWKRDTILGLLLAVAIMALFYSSFGSQFEVLQTGWIRAFQHWTAMHGQCRLCGPPFFYILLFLLYELPIFILAVVGTVQFATRHLQVPSWLTIRRGMKTHATTGELVEKSLQQVRGETSPGKTAWDRNELFFGFCIWWMLVSLAAYGYIGEKVPWLIIHQLLPMIFVSVYLLSRKKIAFALIGCIFLALLTWHVAFVPADVNEPIVQVQNSEDMREVMRLIDASDTVVVASKDYWPLPWYYRGDRWDKFRFYGALVDKSTVYATNADLVITHDLESYEALDGFDKKTYKLSYWFSIYDNDKRIPEYYFKRDGKMGSINIDVFTRNLTGTGVPVAG